VRTLTECFPEQQGKGILNAFAETSVVCIVPLILSGKGRKRERIKTEKENGKGRGHLCPSSSQLHYKQRRHGKP
jgi:hypothetical protein